MNRVSQIVSNKWVVLAARLLLGGIFLASAIAKLQHPALFVDTVVDYNLLPEGLSRFYGTVLPWAELAIGFSLILGLLSLAAAVVGLALTLSFAIAAIYSFSHTTPTLCGCFGDLVALSHSQSLALDAAMFLMGVVILMAGTRADEPGAARLMRGIVHGRPAWLAVALKLAGVGILTLAIGLAITATSEEPADEPPVTGKPRLVYFWNGCPECYGPEVEQVESLQPEYADRVDFVEVDFTRDPSSLDRYGVIEDEFTVLLLSCEPGTDEYHEYARYVGHLRMGTFDLADIRNGLEALVSEGGEGA